MGPYKGRRAGRGGPRPDHRRAVRHAHGSMAVCGRGCEVSADLITPREGDLRVWYIPQIPGKPFEVDAPDMATAKLLLDTLTEFSLFEYRQRVKPDYADAGGIAVYVDGEWEDAEDD